jgi:hypothetical protein
MNTNIVNEKMAIEAIQAAATAVMDEVRNEDIDGVSAKLEQLREVLLQARLLGLSDEAITKTLSIVHQSYTDVVEGWTELLEQVTVSVWLQDPDDNRVRGDTVIIDRYVWENEDDDLLLEETVQQLRDDLEPNWEVIDVASGLVLPVMATNDSEGERKVDEDRVLEVA